MDLICHKCGEPWDIFSVESEDFTEEERKKFHAGDSCPACKWGVNAPVERPFRAQLASELAWLLGDDVDGLASELDDAEYMMGKDFWEQYDG